MKITVYSDLHLEFDPDFRPENPGTDVLVLAGDICVADVFTRSEASPKYDIGLKFKEFFAHCSANWDRVVYIKGNHENYHGDINETSNILDNVLKGFPNIAFLDDDVIMIDDVAFVGSTLWTDNFKYNPLFEQHIRNCMNDYRLVKNGYGKMVPSYTSMLHKRGLKFINDQANLYSKMVVVSHHAPSWKSIDEKHRHDTMINPAYYSDLDEFILDRPQIALWCHGHTHDNKDYLIGSTRVVCNPKGYMDENKSFNPAIVLEI